MQHPEQRQPRPINARAQSRLFAFLFTFVLFLGSWTVKANLPSSMVYTETWHTTIKNDPIFGPTAVPTVSSTLSVSLGTNVSIKSFTTNTQWDIQFGQAEISGYLTNDVNYHQGDTSATIPFIDPNYLHPVGTIFMSWKSDLFTLHITANYDWVDAVDFYTGSTGPISDQSDLTFSVAKITNTTTLYISGRNVNTTDPTTQVSLDNGSVVGKGDFSNPSLTILAPDQNYISANSIVNVSGLAFDDIGVASVYWRWAQPGDNPSHNPDNFDWNSVDTLHVPDSGYVPQETWVTAADMSDNGPGTNILWVVAQDQAEHYSSIHTRQLFWSVPSQFSLYAGDGGKAVGGPGVYNGANLIIDRYYTVHAYPSSTNTAFLNWTDGDGNVVSVTPDYRFLMQDSLSLQANFAPNPFAPIKGTYNGLFSPTNGVNEFVSGFITMNVTARGTYSGTLATESGTFPFHGQFYFYQSDADPAAVDTTFEIQNKKIKPIIGSFHILSDGNGNLTRQMTGTVSVFNNQTLKRIVCPVDMATSLGTTADVAPGVYNIVVPGADNSTQVGPAGYGYGTVLLRSNATAVTTIHLADQGAVISCASSLVEGGSLPVFSSLYGGKGIFIGWLNFASDATTDVSGQNFNWIKRRSKAAFYPEGFHRIFQVVGDRYIAPKSGTNILGWTDGTVSYSDFNFSGSGSVSFDSKLNRFSFPDGNPGNFHLTFFPATGVFSGTFSTGPVLGVSGVVLPKANNAYGYFFESDQSGFVLFTSP